MLRTVSFVLSFPVLLLSANATAEDQPKTLLTRVVEWQYPGSELSKPTMSDGATVDENGNRTVPSVHCKATLVTEDPIDQVSNYYKAKLERRNNGESAASKDRVASGHGRSVSFHSGGADRPVAIHIISINHGNVSTTLVISRAKTEPNTYIAWSQYEKYPLPDQAR